MSHSLNVQQYCIYHVGGNGKLDCEASEEYHFSQLWVLALHFCQSVRLAASRSFLPGL